LADKSTPGETKPDKLKGHKNAAGVLWYRQTNESHQAYEAFSTYRDMGPARSLKKVCEALDKSWGLISRWSGRWYWVDRVEAFDAEENFEYAKRLQMERVKNNIKALEVTQTFQDKVVERLETMNPNNLTPHEMARWVQVSFQIQRAIAGETTENVGHFLHKSGSNPFLDKVRADPTLLDAASRLLDARQELDS
jgi:hypothetical protein